MEFENKVVLVTGSSRGIGLCIARNFAKQGAHVIINNSKNNTILQEACKMIQAEGGSCMAITADVSDCAAVQSLFDQIYSIHRQVDILINNAGISHVGLLTDLPPLQWRQIMGVNLDSVYNCCHLALPKMISAKSGCIINISSIWGISGASCEVAYSASKGGMNAFTRALAKEIGPSGIRVNAIACGVIDTEMNQWLTDEEKESLLEQVPLMKIGSVQHVSDLCLYLASEKSHYLTGQIIPLDGGML